MKKTNVILKNILITSAILCVCFVLCLVIQYAFEENALSSAIFVLGVFLTSVLTSGYIYGFIAAFVSVLAVNFAFTFPLFTFDFTIPENIISAIILFVVTVVACSLTTKLKMQEIIKAESEKERMRANLLRAVSHDLRTPLTTIYGSCSAILENYNSFTDAQKIKMISGIKEDSEWLMHMVENILSVTRIDSGKVKIIKSPTALDELIDSVILKFKKRYPEHNVELDIPDDFVVIPMDAILIEQVIFNLLENAVHHAEGFTKLVLKVFVIGDNVIFEVSDNGCGIAKERLEHIFTGYYDKGEQSGDMLKRNVGIGLSVCDTIIKAHGGTISAENAKGGGAIFRFVLNIEEEQKNEQQ